MAFQDVTIEENKVKGALHISLYYFLQLPMNLHSFKKKKVFF